MEALNKLSLSFIEIDFDNDHNLITIDGSEMPIEGENIFCWGSVRLAHIASKRGWNPGSLYNLNHDMMVYGEKYGEHMLNHDGFFCNFSDDFEPPSPIFFVRPCADTKAFTGQLFFQKDSWNDFASSLLSKRSPVSTLSESTKIQVCKRKDIYREIRTWVVDGRVIDASQYRIGSKTIYAHCSEPEVLDFAQRMVDIYQPAKAFVLDVCMTSDGMKVVEVNCINCSGFYDVNMQKLLSEVHSTFEAHQVLQAQ